MIAVHGTKGERLAIGKECLEFGNLAVKIAMGKNLPSRLDETLARVEDVLDLHQAAAACNGEEGLDGVQKGGGAAGLEDEFARVHKHAAFAEHVRVHVLVAERTDNLTVDTFEETLPHGPLNSAQSTAPVVVVALGVGLAIGAEDHLKQFLGSLEEARAGERQIVVIVVVTVAGTGRVGTIISTVDLSDRVMTVVEMMMVVMIMMMLQQLLLRRKMTVLMALLWRLSVQLRVWHRTHCSSHADSDLVSFFSLSFSCVLLGFLDLSPRVAMEGWRERGGKRGGK